jgi:deazaflavin-dependent oxidoreductase (nitroreductase family)
MAVELTPKGTRGWEMPKVPRLLVSTITGLIVVAYRLFGDRMRVIGQPLVLLITVGARSGRARRTLVCRFSDGDDGWLVVASFGGSARHPAWYVNMARSPDKVWVEIGKRTLEVRPESLKAAEREEAWRRIVSLAPAYAAYQEKTDREIPVVRLRPNPGPSSSNS